jgi:hypothetical protein
MILEKTSDGENAARLFGDRRMAEEYARSMLAK